MHPTPDSLKSALLNSAATHEGANFSKRSERYTRRAELRDELVDTTHLAPPSRSATIASIASRSSCCWATMSAISAFNEMMSTASEVSSASTYDETDRS